MPFQFYHNLKLNYNFKIMLHRTFCLNPEFRYNLRLCCNLKLCYNLKFDYLDKMKFLRNALEIRFEEFRLMTLNFPVLDGNVIQESVQLNRLVGSCAVLVLQGHRETETQAEIEENCLS